MGTNMLISIEAIKFHLHLDPNPDSEIDPSLEDMLDSAVDYASQYLGRPIPWKDSEGADVEVPASVRQALLLLVGDFYENREETVIGASVAVTGYIERLLHFYRVGLGV